MSKPPNPTFLIFSQTGDWQVLNGVGQQLTVSGDLDFQAKLGEVKHALVGDSEQQVGTVILLGSGECLCVDSQKTASIQAEQFLFELEEHLPLDAEQMVLAKKSFPSQIETVADREKLEQLLGGLESIGVSVQRVLPATLFALQASKVEVKSSTFVVQFFDGVDVFTFDEKGMTSWIWHERKSFSWSPISQEIRFKDRKVYTNFGVNEDRIPEFVESFDLSMDTLIELDTKSVLRNPWISFPVHASQFAERDYGKASAVALIVIVLVLAIIVNLGLWIAGSRYHAKGEQNIVAQQSILKAVSPGARRRANVESYLKSRLAEEERNQVVLETLGSVGQLNEVVDVLSCLRNSREIDLKKISYSARCITLYGESDSTQALKILADTIEAKGYDIVRNNKGSSKASQRGNFSWQISPGEGS